MSAFKLFPVTFIQMHKDAKLRIQTIKNIFDTLILQNKVQIRIAFLLLDILIL